MKDIAKFHKQGKEIIKIFCDFMKEKGLTAWEHDSIGSGFGATAFDKKDRFIPIFKLYNLLSSESYSIFVEDRNGNPLLKGNTAAIYSLDINENWTEEEIEKKFKIMLKDVYSKYGKYNKSNRLDFSFRGLFMEKKEYSSLRKLQEENNEENINDNVMEV